MQKDMELHKDMDLNKLVDLIPGGIVILNLDEDLTIQYANAGYYQLLGFTEEEFNERFGRKSLLTLCAQDLEATVRSLYRQLSEKSKFYLETRLIHKKNEAVIVGFYGMLVPQCQSWDQAYCILADITEQKEMMRLFKQEQEVNRIIRNLSKDILFDMRITEVSLERFEQLLNNRQVILPEDREKAEYLIAMIRRGNHSKIEFRAKNKLEEVSVYQILYDYILDDNQNPWRAVGKIMDITEKKRLEARAVRDPLTRLYNKVEIRNQIDAWLHGEQEEQQLGSFLILDIDNFKNVNDWLGHHYGDTVLVQLAVVMREQLPENARIGRIGGDEFIAFLPRTAKEEAGALAERLRAGFSKHYRAIQTAFTISCSIGISLYPKDGNSFEHLYQRADAALYEAKHEGKDRYRFYEPKK